MIYKKMENFTRKMLDGGIEMWMLTFLLMLLLLPIWLPIYVISKFWNMPNE